MCTAARLLLRLERLFLKVAAGGFGELGDLLFGLAEGFAAGLEKIGALGVQPERLIETHVAGLEFRDDFL